MEVKTIKTTPFTDQKPGTSGLRKPTKTFQQEHYTENFVQAILSSIGDELKGATLVVGGDGRFYMKEAVVKIIQMCAASGARKLIVGQGGILSTPAVSCMIRKSAAIGGIVLTASHNPGGPDADFGIKFNTKNGGPAPSAVTDKIFELSKNISEYKLVPSLTVNIDKIGNDSYQIEGLDSRFIVEIVDSVEDYLALMKEVFDFEKIYDFLHSQHPFTVLIDTLHGVMGPYARRVFVDEFHLAPEKCLRNSETLPDFGGGHPDPNLTYAKGLVEAMRTGWEHMGAAFDGDGDRNMIIGHKAFFVTPCDSLAILADHAEMIPYFKKHGIAGVARSMPTSGAVDRVAKAKGLPCYEVPTGWKFFGNLMDDGKIRLCGEESFGTGSDHIREKDGLWAVLAWLSILSERICSVEEVVRTHWAKYGRNVFTRYDYEDCEAEPCQKMMEHLQKTVTESGFVGKTFTAEDKKYVVKLGDNFSYTDPVDGSVTTGQGIRVIFEDDSRIIWRLSGTGSKGATVRLYIDSYESDSSKHYNKAQELLKPLIEVAMKISNLKEYTGRDEPTVIT